METKNLLSSKEQSAAERNLDHLWNQFVSSQNNSEKFTDYLRALVKCYSDFIDFEFKQLCNQHESRCSVDFAVPDELLPSLKYRLLDYSKDILSDWQLIENAKTLVQALIILARNFRTTKLVSSGDFLGPVLLICEAVLDKVSCDRDGLERSLYSYVHCSLHYLECLYDPCFRWRLSLTQDQEEVKVGKCETVSNPVGLDMHIVPFVYECFQRNGLDAQVQMRLLHLFGAIISGSQINSLKAICPATVDVLIKVLQTSCTGRRASSDATDHVMRLTSLVLRCLVATIHTLHHATPEERQVEVGAVLDSYFQVLLKLCDSECNISLEISMLGALETMLSLPDKYLLQNTFMASGACLQLLTFVRAITRWPLFSQTLTTAVIRVFGHLLASSTTAKEKFLQTVGYDSLFDALKNIGQPTEPLLISLLELAAERKYNDAGALTVKNSPVAMMLLGWLPEIDGADLQSWLSTCLYQMCTADTWSLTQCCNSGVNAVILNCLQRRDSLDTKTIGDLLDLLESTGSLFISQTDLKQLVRLFKSDQGMQVEVWVEKRLLKAMSKMAEADNKQIPATLR